MHRRETFGDGSIVLEAVVWNGYVNMFILSYINFFMQVYPEGGGTIQYTLNPKCMFFTMFYVFKTGIICWLLFVRVIIKVVEQKAQDFHQIVDLKEVAK